MSLSLQEFCYTTSKMLDSELPPSSDFCVPGAVGEELKITPGGDVIARKLILEPCG